MQRPISTNQHVTFDMISAAAMPIIGRLLNPKAPAKRLMGLVAGLAGAQTMVTDFEGGKVGLLPMQAHLTSDLAIGVGLIAAAALMKKESTGTRALLAGLGVFSLAVAAMTDPIPDGKGRVHALKTARKVERVAGETVGELAGA